jgi:glycosyltransferase involved in cell wall biosynthesis
MKISIITAAYNSASTLHDTIESVIRQSYKDYEHIVVDGKSKDNTVDILKEYEETNGKRLRWISESDRGIYDAILFDFPPCPAWEFFTLHIYILNGIYSIIGNIARVQIIDEIPPFLTRVSIRICFTDIT